MEMDRVVQIPAVYRMVMTPPALMFAALSPGMAPLAPMLAA
jgi:hypothetical protein